MATGENLFSLQDARNLVRYAGLRPGQDVLRFDCALSYGLVEYLRMLEMLGSQGWNARLWRFGDDRRMRHGNRRASRRPSEWFC